MKLLNRNFTKNGEGTVKLLPEQAEDLWHAYNIIRQGDQLTATTLRKVIRDNGISAESERVKLLLTLEVLSVDYEPEVSIIRVQGKNLTESEHIKLGAHHTLELDLQRTFTLHKDIWDILDIDRINQACDPSLSADLAAVLITEGLAHVCLVAGSITVVRAKIEATIPRKRGAAAAGYDKAWSRFLENVFTAVNRFVDFSVVKCLVIAGPGFAKESFKEYLHAEAVKRSVRPLIEHKDVILLAPASTAYKHSLKEVLMAPGIANRIKDTKAAREVQALQEFFDQLAADPARAFYGPGHVLAAAELGAIAVLLISDSLFRTNDVQKRKRYAALVDGVREAGGETLIFSSAHVSGEQLNQLSGVAAILRFPLPDLEDMDFPEGE